MADDPEPETRILKMRPEPLEGASTATRAEGKAPSEHSRTEPATSLVGSPLAALERDEILRTRWFSALVIVLVLIAGFATAVIPGGDPLARDLMYLAVTIGIASMLFIVYQTLDPVRFRQPRTALGWFFPSVCVNAGVLFFGVFSPAPMVAVYGIYFLGLGRSAAMAIVGYAICAMCHAAMAFVVISGGRDPGIVRPDLTVTQQLIVQAIVQIVLATTIVTARLSRRTALLAVGELEQATRVAAHRQALLLEARDELDRALRDRRGRFSEQQIGPYALGDVLGRGAMGEVYAATDTRSDTPVAVKLLASTSLGNRDHVLRFMRELRTATAVVSPNVVRVLEVGDAPVPYLVMERLEGAPLSEILRQRRTLPPREVVDLVAQVGVGIAAAASAGVIHRDLKPQNIFRHHGTWKVLDFGVARALAHGDTLTAGHLVGTPSYMAPEQASGATIDHRTDLYALAAVAYRALTGHPPFAAADIAETLYRVVHTRPVRPTLLAPELPADVDLVLAIGMAARPTDRFADAAELARHLADAVDGSLPPAVRARGEALVHAAGWSSGASRGVRPLASLGG